MPLDIHVLLTWQGWLEGESGQARPRIFEDLRNIVGVGEAQDVLFRPNFLILDRSVLG